MRRRDRKWLARALGLGVALLLAAPASAATGVQHLHFRYGPLTITPGQNLILLGPNLEKPPTDGYLVGMRASLTRTDGTVPPVTQIHLHHGVWLNAAHPDSTASVPERFFAAGEEKTYAHLPAGYGYAYRASDPWLMNYMIHNLTPNPDAVYITYDIDFVPAESPLAASLRPVRPIWMDVRNGESYPVFDAGRGSSANGVYTYPDGHPGAYADRGRALNMWTVDRPGTLVWAGGHLHPGGLFDDLDLIRPGATLATAAPTPPARCVTLRRRTKAGRRRHRPRRCTAAVRPLAPIPGAVANSVRIFRSDSVNYDPGGRVSWDMSMTTTDPGWRVAVKPGDRLRIRAAYDTSKGSWYESMGIMTVWMATGDQTGVDPFRTAVASTGQVTHGPLPENAPGGGAPQGLPDPANLAGTQPQWGTVNISNFEFQPGDQALSGPLGAVPTIRTGERLNFVNNDAALSIFHSVTACRAPCNRAYGASYPLADGTPDFDSGQLGVGPPGLTAAAQRITWETPSNLPAGTYSFFCRIHPWMRGAFRVVNG